MPKQFYLSIALLFLTAISFQSFAQQKSGLIPADPLLRTGKLPNGLTYYIRPNKEPGKKAELRLVVNAGSLQENDDQRGLAHFIEHMAFNGTKHFQKNELISYLQTTGVQFGRDLNAYTSFNETVYILPIPTEKPESLDKGLEILEDWASNISFDPIEIDKERGVILEEKRMRQGANERMFKIDFETRYRGTPYPNRMPIGTEEVLRTFKPETLTSFYRDWYRPNLMAVIVVGDIDPVQVEQNIKTRFSSLKNPDRAKAKAPFAVKNHGRMRGLVITDPEGTGTNLTIHYGLQKSKPILTTAEYERYLAQSATRGLLGWRISEINKAPAAPFVFGQSAHDADVRGYEEFSSFIMLKDNVDRSISTIVQENERARVYGFTTTEFEAIKKRASTWIEQSYNERDKVLSSQLAGDYVGNFLRGEALIEAQYEYETKKKFWATIKLDKINAIAKDVIPSSSSITDIVYMGTSKASFKLPSQDELRTITQEAAKAKLKAVVDQPINAELMSSIPGGGVIVSESVDTKLGIMEIRFSNNVTVILKPTDFKNDEVMIKAFRLGGNFTVDPKDRINSEMATTFIYDAGVASFSASRLDNVLAGKNASMFPGVGDTYETATGASNSVDVETMLQLLYLKFTQPRKDTAQFRSTLMKYRASSATTMSSPNAVFQDSVYAIRYGKHAWIPRSLKPEHLNSVNIDRMYEIYNQRFGNAHGFLFVMVGSFDVEKLKPLVTTYLGGLPSMPGVKGLTDVGMRPVEGPLKKEIKKGVDSKSTINLFWNGEVPYSNEEPMKVRALVDVLNLRITESLREDLGGVYSGSFYGGISKNPYSNYGIQAVIPTGPEYVDRIVPIILKDIEKIKANGPTESDLQKVKEAWKQQYRTSIRTNEFWLNELTTLKTYEMDLDRILTYESRVEKLSGKDVQEAAVKYLDDKFVEIIHSPEK